MTVLYGSGRTTPGPVRGMVPPYTLVPFRPPDGDVIDQRLRSAINSSTSRQLRPEVATTQMITSASKCRPLNNVGRFVRIDSKPIRLVQRLCNTAEIGIAELQSLRPRVNAKTVANAHRSWICYDTTLSKWLLRPRTICWFLCPASWARNYSIEGQASSERWWKSQSGQRTLRSSGARCEERRIG